MWKYLMSLMFFLLNFNSSAVKEGEELRNDPDFRHTYATLLAVERAEGKEEGRDTTTKEIVVGMLRAGAKDALILQVTNITPEDLEYIKRQSAFSASAPATPKNS